MRTVNTLIEADRGSVWRCSDCTLAWREGAWCRLDTLGSPTWTPLNYTPQGPFYDLGPIDKLSYSDFRNVPRLPDDPDFTPTFPRQANTPLLGWPGPNE